MPDYFISLVMQYTSAVNSDQAERYARSVVNSWYLSLDSLKQKKLKSALPDYLKPKARLFFAKRINNPSMKQYYPVINRMMHDLSLNDEVEATDVYSGVMKSLKIISSHQAKFAYSQLLDSKLSRLYIEA